MISKLFKGELSLAATFWKFGFLGLILLKYLTQMFGHLLNQHLQGISIYNFFLHHFNFITSPKLSILWTLCYVSMALVLAVYSWKIIFAVWRSANSYEKSSILAFFAKIGILLLVATIWNSLLFKIVL